MRENHMVKAGKWINIFVSQPKAKIRLFCFPYSGGGSIAFRTWPQTLPQCIEVCAVQFPGRESRYNESPFNRIAPLVEAACEALMGYLDKPFAFFGHSLGALVSFEVARRLAAKYEIYLQQLFVSAFRAPQLRLSYAPVHNLPKAELLDIISKLHGTPQGVLRDPQLVELLLPTIRADLAICETYSYEPGHPLATPVMTYGGVSDPRVSHSELDAWREQTTGEFFLKLFEGGHFFLNTNKQEVLLDVAEVLTRRIAQL